MKKELQRLKEIIYRYDELIDYWFNGYNSNLLAAGGEDVYEDADNCRNEALEIIKKLLENA